MCSTLGAVDLLCHCAHFLWFWYSSEDLWLHGAVFRVVELQPCELCHGQPSVQLSLATPLKFNDNKKLLKDFERFVSVEHFLHVTSIRKCCLRVVFHVSSPLLLHRLRD